MGSACRSTLANSEPVYEILTSISWGFALARLKVISEPQAGQPNALARGAARLVARGLLEDRRCLLCQLLPARGIDFDDLAIKLPGLGRVGLTGG